MALTPIQLNAAAGLMQNQGLTANANLVAAVASYASLPYVQAITGAITVAATGNAVANTTVTQLQTLATNLVPALGDSAPNANINLANTSFSGLISLDANLYLGNGDVGKFCQSWSTAQGYIAQTNEYIRSASQSQSYLGPTFTSMDSLQSGGVLDITTDPQLLGADLKKLGQLIEPADLENWGTPMALVRQLINLTGIVPPPIQVAFVTLGIDQTIAVNLDDPTVSVTDQIQKIMWSALQGIRNDSLKQLLQILEVTTANISTAADLLNPQKILPNSYQTLRCPTAVGFVPVYVNDSINSVLEKQLPPYVLRSTDQGYQMTAIDRMRFMTTGELAVANKSFAVCLLQLNNVVNSTLQDLADAVIAVEKIDQPLVNSQTQPVPGTNADFFAAQMAPGGTGPGNTLVICDVLGTPTGRFLTDQFSNTVSNLLLIDTSAITADYQTMQTAITGGYGNNPTVIPAGSPAAGTYSNIDGAVLALITTAQGDIASIQVASANACANLNSLWSTMGNQITREQTLQTLANIVPATQPANNKQSVMSFVESIPESGLDLLPGGERYYLTSVANTSALPGQSIIAAMTEGVNDAALGILGAQSGAQIT